MGDNNFTNLIIIISIVGGLLLIAVIVTIFILFRRKNNKKTPKENTYVNDNNKWVNAFGGKDNLISLEAKGSRLIVKLNNYELVNKDELHNLGVASIISSQDKITLVLKDKAENICNLLQ